MSREPHSFKRLVLGLQPGAHDRTMRLAVELADLLHLDLLGLFLEDTSLLDLAGIPFSREFRPLGGGWHTLDLDRLLHDFELAARSIERKFMGAAKRLPPGCQFEVARGSLATRRHRHDRRAPELGRAGHPAILMAIGSSLPVSRRCHARPAAYHANQGP